MRGTYSEINIAVTETIDEHKPIAVTCSGIKRELASRWLTDRPEPFGKVARFFFWLRFAVSQLFFTKRWAG